MFSDGTGKSRTQSSAIRLERGMGLPVKLMTGTCSWGGIGFRMLQGCAGKGPLKGALGEFGPLAQVAVTTQFSFIKHVSLNTILSSFFFYNYVTVFKISAIELRKT